MPDLGLKMGDLFPDRDKKAFTVPHSSKEEPSGVKPEIVCTYQYQDHNGQDAYQVVRLKPKSFRQRHMVEGKWIWSMDGVERVLYRLPQVIASEQVIIVEGEKDADKLVELGFCATCNVGGAGKWLDSYTESLAGKDIIICGDNDDAGKKHVDIVFESIADKAKKVRIVHLPKTIKDASDYLESFKTAQEAKRGLEELMDISHPFIKGKKLPLSALMDIEGVYHRHVCSSGESSFDWGRWLPTMGRSIRPSMPGELVFILGNTGHGKTAVLGQIAMKALPLPTLLFELELPPELLFERFVANKTKMTCKQVAEAYKSGDMLGKSLDKAFPNLLVCTEARVSLDSLEEYISRAELRLGERPKLVLVDYIQLMPGAGANRRERVSDIAEGLKALAKSTRTIIICTSQVHRPGEEEEIGAYSAKETGSIENSCGLLLGVWLDKGDSTLMHVKVLKSTKGGGGTEVLCNFDGSRMTITERSQFTQADVP
jgi:5S rRNA maturation endonuclease (ribonuclease M5)